MRKLLLALPFISLALSVVAQPLKKPVKPLRSEGRPPGTSPAPEPVDYVNVFTGTSNSRWALFPGATLPFGLVKLSPDNQSRVWTGGYEYTVSSISGFSHLHAMTLSGLSVMPATGPLERFGQTKTFAGEPDGPFNTMWTSGYRSRFEKSTEKGSPGYYSVHLADPNVRAEVSATTRTGWLRFTFPETGNPNSDEMTRPAARILFDFDIPAEEDVTIQEVVVTRPSPTEIEGYIKQNSHYPNDFTVYFVTQLSRPADSLSAWQTPPYSGTATEYGTQWRAKAMISHNLKTFRGKGDCGVFLSMNTRAGEQVVVKSGISFVSIEQARLNLTTETKAYGFNFDAVVARARRTWNELLSRVEVSGPSEADKQTFYTNLYRAYTGRSILSDVNGMYTDPMEKPQQAKAPADAVYSSDGFWGAQWNLFPLWTLLTPAYANSWVNSFLEMYDNGGWMPEAPTGIEYAPIMGSQHHKSLVVSSYQKGIRNFDVQKAWAAFKHDLTTPGSPQPGGGFAGNRQLTPYLNYGFVPDEDGATSNTLEYAYDDYTAAQFAKALGKTDDYNYFLKRSDFWKNQFDPGTGFMRRRHRDSTWVSPVDNHKFGTVGGWNGTGFMEGTAWIYSFFVPHNIPELVSMVGRDRFNQRLEEGFAKGYVDLGNQPNLQAPFLFNYSGKPWLTQKYSRQVLRTLFNNSPLTGWVGEEDEGQLSSLYVLMAMGLFEMDGGTSTRPYYDLSSPLFSRTVLHLDKQYYGGKTFVIEAPGNSATNIYIQSAMLNGKTLTRPVLYHDEIVKGGKLVLQMGPKPNMNWGISTSKTP